MFMYFSIMNKLEAERRKVSIFKYFKVKLVSEMVNDPQAHNDLKIGRVEKKPKMTYSRYKMRLGT